MMKQKLRGQNYSYNQSLEGVSYRDISKQENQETKEIIKTFSETLEYCDYVKRQVTRETQWLHTATQYLNNWSKIVKPCEGEYDEVDFTDYKLNLEYKILTERSLKNAKNTFSSLQAGIHSLVTKPCIAVCDAIKQVIDIDHTNMIYLDPKIDQVLDNIEINNTIRKIKKQTFERRTVH